MIDSQLFIALLLHIDLTSKRVRYQTSTEHYARDQAPVPRATLHLGFLALGVNVEVAKDFTRIEKGELKLSHYSPGCLGCPPYPRVYPIHTT